MNPPPRRPIAHAARGRIATVALAALAVLHGAPAPAHDGPHQAARPGPVAGASATVRLEDAELLDSRARPVRFRQDAIGDRIVAISFVYTTCTTVCPMVTSVFADLQRGLGDRLGREVWLVSISIDPATDTPQRLAEYADRFGAKPGWVWLTGDKQPVARVLKGLGAYTPDFESHPPMVLVGDARTQRWTRFNGMPAAQQLVPALDRLVAARRQDASRAAR